MADAAPAAGDSLSEAPRSLRKETVSGVAWTGGSSVVQAVLQLVRVTVLARMLSPDDFGLMAMVTVIVAVAEVMANMGLGEAIIYRQTTSRDHLSSLYWLNVAGGIAAFAIIWASTPLFVRLYSEPRLVGIIFWVAVSFAISGPGRQFEVLLRRDLRFKMVGGVEVTSAVTATIVAIVMAVLGAGVYALVWGLVAGSVSKTLVLFATAARSYLPRLHFRTSDLRGYVGFGAYRTGELIVNQVILRCGQLLMGIVLGASALGFYQMAYNIAFQPVTQVNPILVKVTFPVFAKMQNDIQRLKRGFFLQMRFLSLITVPLLFGIAAVARPFVSTVLGNEWLPAVPILQVLALLGLMRSLNSPIQSILMVSGRLKEFFWWNVVLLVALVPSILIGASLDGPVGVAIVWLILQTGFTVITYLRLTRPILGPCLGDYATSMGPAILAGAVMGALVYFASHMPATPSGWAGLMALVTLGILIYAAELGLLLKRDLVLLLGRGRAG
ncbi:MAG TPA: MOP flippase family protein, partial [Dehalococcoidia bacterium]|nr:MOP flippase family protein [Dehalococcoidia bacterium]